MENLIGKIIEIPNMRGKIARLEIVGEKGIYYILKSLKTGRFHRRKLFEIEQIIQSGGESPKPQGGVKS